MWDSDVEPVTAGRWNGILARLAGIVHKSGVRLARAGLPVFLSRNDD